MSIYRDKTRGCYVFEFDRRIEGRRVRVSKLLPKTWTRTQADAYDRKESARLYAVATGAEKPTYSIEDAVTLYLKERVKKLKSASNITGELAQMYWAYQGKALTDLAQVCADYTAKATRGDGKPLSSATIRNRIRYLTSACRYAWKHHGMGDRDPAERVVAPQVNNARNEYLSREEMLMIAKACRCQHSRAMIRIAFYSGMRMSEILSAAIDGDTFVLADTKNGQPRHVPIHPKIASSLHLRTKDRYWVSKRFKEAAKKVGMAHLRFHDLRHSAASAMINEQVDLYTVGAVLGHKSPASTRRYAHLATDSLRAALEKVGRKSPDAKRKRVA